MLNNILNIVVATSVLLERSLATFCEARPSEIFPDDYDKYDPPKNKGKPAHVYLQLSVMDVDKIDDGAMEFSILSYLGELWNDTRLNLTSYKNESYGNTLPDFPPNLVKYLWLPDLVFDNTKSGVIFHLSLPNTFIKVNKDGSLYRLSRYNLVVGCHMDFRYYPMDTQECFIKISLMSNPDSKVVLHWIEDLPNESDKSILFVNHIQPLKYTLAEPEPYTETELWPSGNYTYLYANFTFIRRISGSVFNVYVPSTMVVFLSWISFWLDIEAVPARVTLGVTSLLTLATQVAQAHSHLPSISYMTGIDVWLFACLLTVFSSLLEFAFAYQLFVLNKQAQQVKFSMLNKILNIVVATSVLWGRSQATFSEERPPDIFPRDYDNYNPPSTKGKPADVYLRLLIIDVDKIDNGAMEFSILSYLTVIWNDTRLNFTSYERHFYDNDLLIFPPYLIKYLWLPDLVFDNTKTGMIFHLSLPNTVIKVQRDGSFMRSTRYNLVVGCHMDFHYYPMDTQKCFIKICLLANPDSKVLLHWIEDLPNGSKKSILFMNNIQPLEYTLSEPKPYKETEKWPTGNYTYLYANFTFIRRISGSLFNVYVPSTLVVFLSWISFWLDIEAVPARITLGVTSLLTLATQIAQAHSHLPTISYMTGLDVWLFACLITVFSSLLEFAFAYQLYVLNKQQAVDHELSRTLKVLTRREGQLSRSRLTEESPANNKIHSVSNSISAAKVDQKSLDKISRKIFPAIFLSFCSIYWSYYLYLK